LYSEPILNQVANSARRTAELIETTSPNDQLSLIEKLIVELIFFIRCLGKRMKIYAGRKNSYPQGRPAVPDLQHTEEEADAFPGPPAPHARHGANLGH